MDLNKYYESENEQPLDNIVEDGGFTAIFRTIACVGDSMSSGEIETVDKQGISHYRDIYEQSWGQYIARQTGSTVYNFSCGGMTAKEYCDNFANEKGFWEKSYAAQAYIIALGVNDIINCKGEMGDVDDIDLTDKDKNKPTFVGYYAKIIQKYKEIQPNAKFFLVTMPRENNSDDSLKKDFAKMINKIATVLDNTYVIDLFKYAPVFDDKFREHFFLAGHMTPQGYLLSAKMISSYIDFIIRNNYKEFTLAGVIGKDIKL